MEIFVLVILCRLVVISMVSVRVSVISSLVMLNFSLIILFFIFFTK